MRTNRIFRLLLMALAIGALLAGMWAGLIRIGWGVPPLLPLLPSLHGPLMVGGFLGTLIGLERAVGTGKRWAFAGPALTARQRWSHWWVLAAGRGRYCLRWAAASPASHYLHWSACNRHSLP